MTDLFRVRAAMRWAHCAAAAIMLLAAQSSPAAARCLPGEVSVGNNKCIPAGASLCGDGKYCNAGEYCSSPVGVCYVNGDTDCHNGHSCRAGSVCTPDGCRDPNARTGSNGSGCGSDITGTGGGSQRRTNCGPNPAQVAQQHTQRQEFRKAMNVAGGGLRTSYSFSFGYTSSSAPAYREDPQVIYEKVKQECGATPTTECAGRVINPNGLREDMKRGLNEAALKRRLAALAGPVEDAVPQGSGPAPSIEHGGPAMAGPASSSEEQSLFCHVVLERIQSGDLGYSRDEQIPAECRRDQEIIAALAKAKAEHPFVTFSGPDTENEITRLLRPVVSGDDALEKQMPPEPKSP